MPTLGQETLIKLNGLHPKRNHENGMETCNEERLQVEGQEEERAMGSGG